MAFGRLSQPASRPAGRASRPDASRPRTGSLQALQVAMLQIQALEQTFEGAHQGHLDADLLTHAVELSDTACFSVSAAEAEYSAARADYEASFSPLRRRMKKFGSRTKAYRAANVEPREAKLAEARAVFEKASELKNKVEKTKASEAESFENTLMISHCSTFLPTSSTFGSELLSVLSEQNPFDASAAELL